MVRQRVILVALILAAAVGCEKRQDVNIVSSPYATGKTHTEPVVFNGKWYDVAFTFKASANLYDVDVSGKGGRPLGGGDGDRKIVEQIGTSTVRHFACRDSQKARLVPGSSRHAGTRWQMQARCS